MIPPGDLTGCILAGGRATRMGGLLKPLLVVDGATILERQRAVLAPRVGELVIALAGPGPLAEHGLRAVFDVVADAGPLAGMAAGLRASARPWLLVVAGDMPSIAGGVLDLLRAHATPEVDAVVPWVGGFPEPLLALYGRDAAPAIERRLAAGQRSVQGALGDLRVARVDEPALREVDAELASFRNLNRPEQL